MSVRILIGLFGAILIAGVAAYLFTADAPTEKTETIPEEAVEPTPESVAQTGTGSIGDLLAEGEQVVCDFSSYTEETGSSVAGTFYVSEGRVRSNFESEQAGVTYISHLLLKDNTIYTWTSVPKTEYGSMFSMGEDGADHPSIAQTFDYKCQAWEGDEAVFDVPDDVSFRDRTDAVNVSQ